MTFTYRRAFITIAAQNWQQSVTFYQTLCQTPPLTYQADRYAEFDLAGLRIGIYRPKAAEIVSPQPYPLLSLCLEVSSLEAAIAHLTDSGYPVPAGIQTISHGREVYAYDPDGNRLILYEPN
jgi:predicted enzyme related to lactoylglutathione lyase